MPQDVDEVGQALQKALAVARKINNSVAPNEDLHEFKYETLLSVAKNLSLRLNNLGKNDLISQINLIIGEIDLPDIETDAASRGMLVAKVQALELVTTLRKAQSIARSCGYADPDTANIDLSTVVSEEFIDDVTKKLNEVEAHLAKLNKEISHNRQIGVSISAGPLSVDVGTLMQLVESSTRDARSYIASRAAVSAQTLKDKLEIVNATAGYLRTTISEKAETFGARVLGLTTKLAKAAAEAYARGLVFIKSIFTAKVDRASQDDEDPFKGNIEALRSGNAHIDATGLSAAVDIEILKGIMYKILEMPQYSATLKEFKVSECKIRKSHNNRYLFLKFLRKKHNEYMDGRFVVVDIGIESFKVFQPLAQDYLTDIANKAFSEVLEERERPIGSKD